MGSYPLSRRSRSYGFGDIWECGAGDGVACMLDGIREEYGIVASSRGSVVAWLPCGMSIFGKPG